MYGILERVLKLNSVNFVFKINVPLKRNMFFNYFVGFPENTILISTNKKNTFVNFCSEVPIKTVDSALWNLVMLEYIFLCIFN